MDETFTEWAHRNFGVRLEHAGFAFGSKEEGLRLAENFRRQHPEICRFWAYRPDRQAALAAVHAAKHLRVKCGPFAARRYAEKRGASALMYQIAEEFEEKRSRKCK